MTRIGFALLLMAFLVAPAGAQSFGGSIAIGDDDIFVSEVRNRIFPGEVYVFDRDSNWQVSARLMASDATDAADKFGRALAAGGSTLLVGASGRDSGEGAVYVFTKDAAGGWTEVAMLTGSRSEGGAIEGSADAFGGAIVMRDDIAFISAPGFGDNSGSAYVFERDADGDMEERQHITAADGAEGDLFGSSLAMEGSLAVVGAPGTNGERGSLYVYERDASSGAWRNTAKVEGDDMPEGSRLGATLHLKEAVIYAGAPMFAQRQGAVFVFAKNADGEYAETTRLRGFETQRTMQFGSSLAFDGDDLWIGAPGENRRAGAIYRYHQDAAGWSGVEKLSSQEMLGRASFGSTIAVRDAVAVVGATGVDSGEGAAFVLERDQGGAWSESGMVVNEVRGFDAIVGDEVHCSEGEAAAWTCKDVDLVSFLPIADIGGKRGVNANDIWGWTDPETGHEYALVGRSDGTSFVDVTDAGHPAYRGDLPMTEGSRPNVWRDIKVYQDHAFIVADGAGEHGMQVFDLAQLREAGPGPVTFEASAHYDMIHSAHNIVINLETGFAFAVGSSGGGETCGGGLHMIDIRDPAAPTFAGCFADPTTGRRKTGYSHDAQCVVYHGPDVEHQGQEICFSSNETAISISDVTDKDNPAPLSMATYPQVAYTHQGWLTEDHRYFYMNDEGDEPQGLVEGTRTLVWDLSDLDDPVLVREYIAETTTTDHNLYIKGDLMYQSNYGSGLRILDISDPEDPVEVGYFDTTPFESGGGGSWSNYPYFESGVIIVTSIGEGLFVLKQREVDI